MSTAIVTAAGPAAREADSARVRFRRALTLVLMTLVVPGSAQLVMGSKRLGRIAVRTWLAVLACLFVLVLISFVSRTMLFTLATNVAFLWTARAVATLLGAGWVVLFVDAWRLGSPLDLRRSHRLVMAGLSTVMCVVTAGTLFFGAHLMAVQQDFVVSVFGGHIVSVADAGRYNVLLLGGDSGKGRIGLRPDSLSVASIDADTGRTVLISLPRNLAKVPFPDGTVMDKQFPRGFDCDGCYLNGINTWAEDHADLFPGTKEPGMTATKQAIEAVTGLKINYFAMVNLEGFSSLVDAVGGVRINVPEDVPIGGIGAPITGYVKAGDHVLDGKETLWFARSRVANNDYSRMARQKCVLSAMLQQLDPKTVVMNVQKIADSSKQMLQTDIPASDLGTFMDLALKARQSQISTVSIVPPAIETYDPDFAKIRQMVSKGIAKADGTSTSDGAQPTANPNKPVKTTDTSNQTDEQRAAAVNETDDLSSVC